ncbi:DNA-binding CsgD family transcriptional regulator [Sphingomonas prati]|uniref:DNA-binding CsgD family transcriptional regulator n=2 Tax=Sphingomonas prati TaxID=1843237 RepID=A0A7W9F2F5_9SPHN|nr:helix-turn-helix transcriptional regulator [Sphingomonas prati]MBB5730338.1 DNA-binding CsgD family transcriptional regulator [Sphingomonas prati]
MSVHLTDREREVLGLVVDGLSSKQVAMALSISPRTVEGHIEHLRLKLGAANRCHMVFIATSLGLLKR